jgi:hypothetical protein
MPAAVTQDGFAVGHPGTNEKSSSKESLSVGKLASRDRTLAPGCGQDFAFRPAVLEQ